MSQPKQLILMQGIPGSGKSVTADALRDLLGACIYSTDTFWEQGEGYNFDASKLTAAHEWNQSRVARAMAGGVQVIIIDNTNIKRRDAKHYQVMAAEHDYQVSVIRVETPIDVCIARQADRPEDRRVPEEIIRRMCNQMEGLL